MTLYVVLSLNGFSLREKAVTTSPRTAMTRFARFAKDAELDLMFHDPEGKDLERGMQQVVTAGKDTVLAFKAAVEG
jgi:hypothetical protein